MSEESVTVPSEPVKKTRKSRAKAARKPAGPRKAAAKMVTYIGTWDGSPDCGNLRFSAVCECQPGNVRTAAATLEPGDYDVITLRKGSVTVEEKRRKAVTLG